MDKLIDLINQGGTGEYDARQPQERGSDVDGICGEIASALDDFGYAGDYEKFRADVVKAAGPHIARVLDRQPQERGEAVAYLCDGMRFKVGPTLRYGLGINGLPRELEGQWVALVDATDDKHMRAHPPAADARVAELEAQLAESAEARFAQAKTVQRLMAELTASREREGRMREALEVLTNNNESMVGERQARAALAAEKE